MGTGFIRRRLPFLPLEACRGLLDRIEFAAIIRVFILEVSSNYDSCKRERLDARQDHGSRYGILAGENFVNGH